MSATFGSLIIRKYVRKTGEKMVTEATHIETFQDLLEVAEILGELPSETIGRFWPQYAPSEREG